METVTCAGVKLSGVCRPACRQAPTVRACRPLFAHRLQRRATFLSGHISATSLASGTNVLGRPAKHSAVARMAFGEDPAWKDDDYIVLGLANCFLKDDNSKLSDYYVIEPVTAGTLECMNNGGVTCYKHAFGTTLKTAVAQDVSLLPEEFQGGRFAEDFDFRVKCAARTWLRQHPQEHLLDLVPIGSIRSDWNFALDDKRILNVENVVNDADNVKQDMSIDVYGRKKEGGNDAPVSEIEKLYNV